MKTYEEMARSALERIDRYKAEQKQKQKIIFITVGIAVAFCMIAALTVGIMKTGTSGNRSPFGNKDNAATSDGRASADDTVTEDGENVSGGDDAGSDEKKEERGGAPGPEEGGDVLKGTVEGSTSSYAYLFWNDLSISGLLKTAIENDPDGVFTVIASYRPTTVGITSFTFEGKTLSEWAIEAEEERLLPEKLTELLKEGDILKYGEALCEEGAPDGMVWARSHYDERIAYYGKELLEKYIKGGVFLRDELENDLDALTDPTTSGTAENTDVKASATEKYKAAYNAYLDTVMPDVVRRIADTGIACERDRNAAGRIIICVTAEELKCLPLEDKEHWYFSLSSDEDKITSGTVTDANGFQCTN